jgi:hypothetical protein
MDTETVFKIIESITRRIENCYADRVYDEYELKYTEGYIDALTDLQEHLQNYIEHQVTGLENQMNGGE